MRNWENGSVMRMRIICSSVALWSDIAKYWPDTRNTAF